ncbi:hypothetical protein MIR68_003518 [Amoeboaphelidium protococcarum]|nr:hypothetical protein MIR68_003518 [Amoeboaphelidium protococcarum]
MLCRVHAIPGIRWSRPERSTQPIAASYPEYMTTMERIKQIGMCTFCKDRVATTNTDDDDQFDTYFDAIENFDVEDNEMGRAQDLTLYTTKELDQYQQEAQSTMNPIQEEPTRQLVQDYTRDGLKSSLKYIPSAKEWLKNAKLDAEEEFKLLQASRPGN